MNQDDPCKGSSSIDNSIFRQMVEQSRDGICITQDGMFRYVNEAFCRMVGYTPQEICAMAGADLLAEYDRERMMEQHFNRLAGKPVPGVDRTTLIHKNGTAIDIEMSASNIEFNGKPASFISARDITDRKRMQEEIEKSELKYRTLVEHAHDGIIITQDGVFKFVNPSFCRIVEYSEQELLEKSFLDLVVEEDKIRLKEYHRLRMEGSRHQMIYEARGISKTGRIIYFELNTTFIEFNGKPATFIIMRDQSERRLLEQNLRTSEQKYRRLFEAESDAIFLVEKDTGNILDANPAASRIYGYTHEEFLQLKNTDVSAEPSSTRQATIDDANYIPVRHHRTKNGTVFPVEITAGVTELEDQVVHIVTVRDITRRVGMEEALRKSEERNRRLINSLQEGLFVIQDEKFIFVNEAIVNILGYSVEDMIGRSFFDIIPPEKQELSRMMHQERKKGVEGSWSYEHALLHKDGKTRIPVILSTNLTEFDGKPAIVGTAKDITDRIRAEEELIKAHRRLEEVNYRLEQTVEERTLELTEANTQLLTLQKENLQSQFDVLKQQVNPHFLFNSLNVLTSLIRLEPDLAEKFTEHLSKVYRYVLENKDNELVTLRTELDFLDAYIFLLKIRFVDKLQVNITISDKQKSWSVIPLAMQLLIENAIKHNAMSKKSPLIIDIFIENNQDLLVVNNLRERESHMASTGIGLTNIQNRYKLLNNTIPTFEKTSTHFLARIPLVKEGDS